jgi:Lamin Tail Domain
MSRALPLVLALLAASFLAAATPAPGAASGGLVVSQVYGGGGNSGATYQNDYVELLNGGSAAVDLSGYTVQYATAAGTSWQTVPLTGTLASGRYYLVQLASGGANGAALPAPDATGSANLATTGGKVALVHAATALTCGASAGSCSAVAVVTDLVGYGSATDFEGAAGPALDSTHAAVRAGGGCTDSANNDADFAVASPAPRNTAAAAAACGGSSGSATGTASVTADIQPALTVSLDQPALAFGSVLTGTTPPRIAERVTVVSNLATGYALSVHRSAFTPSDLPLGLAAVAPAGAALGALLAGGAIAAVPVAPGADLLVGTTAASTSAAGDVWSTQIGFTGPLPAVAPGRYQANVVFTVIGR